MSLFDRFYTHTIKPQSRQKSPVWDCVSSPGPLTFMKLLAKHGPSFEQAWVEYFFHVEPVWNSVALASFHLEFHIQTIPSFRLKLRGEGKQRGKQTENRSTRTKQKKMNCRRMKWLSVIFQMASSWCHWILPLNLCCLQPISALINAKSRLPGTPGEKMLDPQRP